MEERWKFIKIRLITPHEGIESVFLEKRNIYISRKFKI